MIQCKNKMRQSMLMHRNGLSKEDTAVRSEVITDFILSLPLYQCAAWIMTYCDFRQEVRTHEIIQAAIAAAKHVAVPMCVPEERRLIACEIQGTHELVRSYYNIMEPAKEYRRYIDPKIIDLVLVPALAFDRNCQRLGYGAGYYDHFLPQLRKDAIKIGLAYDFQIVESLPVEKHDIPMDMIITESGILKKG